MQRFENLDLPKRLAGIVPAWLVILAVALFGIGFSAMARLLADQFAPGIAAYAFMFPACLLATLLAGWQAGALTVTIGAFLAWQFVVPKAVQAGASMHYQGEALVINIITGAFVIAVAEWFRGAVRRAAQEQAAQLAARDLLFRELRHRVANNFAIVASLLDMQRRRAEEAATRNALEQAMARIRSIARVHRHLYALPETQQVELRAYLLDLCSGLSDASLPPRIRLSCECEQALMAREQVLGLGLVINELVMNAVKHAFPEGREGVILVRFSRTGAGWRLEVADNGVGLSLEERKPGLGTSLIEQFATQAGGKLTLQSRDGTQASLDLPPDAATPFPQK
jgi:two-component sensor histidine kinase